MRVRVKLHGALNGRSPGQGDRFELVLPGGVTAGDLLRTIAERCGAPLCDAAESSDPRFPGHIRMFSDGEMLSSLEQPLVATSAGDASVNVVLLSPMMGG